MATERAVQTQSKQPAPATRAPSPTRAPAPRFPALQAGPPAIRLSARVPVPAPANVPAFSGGGEPLSPSIQSPIESSLGVNLQSVRVHTDAQAQNTASSFSARAFTYGNHIFLGPGERTTDLGLMAHESAHVVQQQGAPRLQRFTPVPGDAYEREAHQASTAVTSSQRFAVHGRTSGAHVQRAEQPNIFQRGVRWLGERATAVLEWAEDRAWGLIEHLAPELAPIIRRGPQGIVDWLKERLSTALDTVVNALAAPMRSITGVVAAVSGHLSRLTAWIQDAYAKISRRDCSPLAEAAAKIEQVFNEIASPVFDRIKALTGRVREFFTGIWNKLGAPVWDFLRQAGGAAWQRIQEFAGWVWDKTAPVRRLAARAWTWVKNRLGIGEEAEGQNGLMQWIQRKASPAWEWVKERIEPIKRPLMIVGGVLLMLSPAGPFIALGAGVAGLIIGIRYLRQMRTPGFIVQMREALHGHIIPGIMSAAHSVTGALSRAASFITGKLDEMTGGMVSLVGAVGGSILRFAIGVVHWIAEQFRALAAWAHDKLMALVHLVSGAFTKLRTFLQPVLDVLGRIIAIAANPLGIIGLLPGLAWRLIPYCFKGPIINFILRIVIRVVRAIPGSPLLGLIWPFIRSGLLGFLEKALEYDTDRKVQIADRFARLATSGSASFVFGYLGGLLLGLWDGISGPFVMLWDIAKLIGGIFSWLWRALAAITDPALNLGRRIFAALRGEWESIKTDIVPAVQTFLSGPVDPMRIINFIRDLLNSIVQAAGTAGGRVFDALIGFLGLGDRELGSALGRFAGNILFEVLLTILTAGGYAAKPIIETLARWVTGAVGKIAKFTAEIRRYLPRIASAVDSVGTFARTNPAMQRIVGSVKRLLSKLGEFFMSMYGIGGTVERGAGTAERAAGATEHAAINVSRAEGSAASRGLRSLAEAIERFIERIKRLAREILSGLGFRRFEVASEGPWLVLYGIGSRIMLARFRKDSIETWIIATEDRIITSLRHARASLLGRGRAAAESGNLQLASFLRSGAGARASENIGVAAAEAIVATRFTSANRLHMGSGKNTLDLIYEVGHGIVVVEAKGLGVGTRMGLGVTTVGPGVQAQQGTVAYLRRKLTQMLDPSRTTLERSAAQRALDALDSGRLRYFLSETSIPPSATTPLATALREFRLR